MEPMVDGPANRVFFMAEAGDRQIEADFESLDGDCKIDNGKRFFAQDARFNPMQSLFAEPCAKPRRRTIPGMRRCFVTLNAKTPAAWAMANLRRSTFFRYSQGLSSVEDVRKCSAGAGLDPHETSPDATMTYGRLIVPSSCLSELGGCRMAR